MEGQSLSTFWREEPPDSIGNCAIRKNGHKKRKLLMTERATEKIPFRRYVGIRVKRRGKSSPGKWQHLPWQSPQGARTSMPYALPGSW